MASSGWRLVHLTSAALAMLLFAAVVPATCLMTPEQAAARAAELFGLVPTDVSFRGEVVPGRPEYSMQLPDGSAVGIDAIDGHLTAYSHEFAGPPAEDWTLSDEQAAAIAGAFCTAKQLTIGSTFQVTTERSECAANDRRYVVTFQEWQDDIRLLSRVGVEVDNTAQQVSSLSSRLCPLSVSLAPPFLTVEAAGQAAVGELQDAYPDATAVVVLGAERSVVFAPLGSSTQRVAWAVRVQITRPLLVETAPGIFEPGPPAVFTATELLDARTGEGLYRMVPAMAGAQPPARVKRLPHARQPLSARDAQAIAQARRLRRDHAQAAVSMSWSARRDPYRGR